MNRTDKIYVAGHRGLVGSAILRNLRTSGYSNIVTQPRETLDLTDARAVDSFFAAERPQYVFAAAARVGGILANERYPADFIRDNISIELNVVSASHRFGALKLLLLGSSCIYPKHAPQPIKEEYLLTGALEPTNEPYAVAKIAGIILCQSYARQYGSHFISAMPTNLYGPGDNFDLLSSHVVPALIRKCHEAKVAGDTAVTVWGSGLVRREFLYVDDLAAACTFLMEGYDDPSIINVGTGSDITIKELIALVAEVVGYRGTFIFDTDRPDGTPRKLLDVSKIEALGWRPHTGLREGIAATYAWYLNTLSANN